MDRPGEALLRLCSEARKEVLLAAPFCKTATLARLMSVVDPAVPIRVVTRWRPVEVATGVSDLEVFELLCRRRAGVLFLRHDLHAKYYRGDDTVLVGSANLTATALGWAPNSNFELLTRPFEARGVLASFETELMRQAVLADGDTRDMVAAAAAMIAVAPSQEGAPAELLAASNPGPCWVPYSRNPENLRAVYAGDHESVAAGARADAERDLAYFDLPRGLGADGFRDAVAVVLRQHPLLLRIDSFAAVPRRFGELRTLVREYLDERSAPENATDLTQRCIRWLRYFTPTRYEFETPKYSEVLVRRRGNS